MASNSSTFEEDHGEILERIEQRLASIESLLQRLPEIQAAVFIQMNEEYQAAHMYGKKSSDLWTIAPPNSR